MSDSGTEYSCDIVGKNVISSSDECVSLRKTHKRNRCTGGCAEREQRMAAGRADEQNYVAVKLFVNINGGNACAEIAELFTGDDGIYLVKRVLSEATAESIEITSLREGSVPGTHTVTYESDDDILELKHTLKSRSALATGAVIAAEFICGKKGVFTMDDLFKE